MTVFSLSSTVLDKLARIRLFVINLDRKRLTQHVPAHRYSGLWCSTWRILSSEATDTPKLLQNEERSRILETGKKEPASGHGVEN